MNRATAELAIHGGHPVAVDEQRLTEPMLPTNHSPKFLVDGNALPLALDALVSLAVDYLQGS